MKNLKLGTKLFLGFGMVLALTGIVGAVTVFMLNSASGQVNKAVGPVLEARNHYSEMSVALSGLRYSVLNYSVNGTEDAWKTVVEAEDRLAARVKSMDDLLAHASHFLPVTTRLMESIRPMTADYIKLLEANHAAVQDRVGLVDDMYNAHHAAVSASDGLVAVIHPFVQADIAGATPLAAKGYTVITAAQTLRDKVVDTGGEVMKTITFKYFPEEMQKSRAMLADLTKATATFRNVASKPDILKAVDDMDKSINAWVGVLNKFETALKNQDNAEKARYALGEKLEDTLNEGEAAAIKSMGTASGNAQASLTTVNWVTIVGVTVSIITGLLVAFFITRNITRPINRIVQMANRAGAGDLTIRKEDFAYDGRDEMGLLVDAIYKMISSQATAVNAIVSIASDVSHESSNLAALSEETNASMEEVQASMDQIARQIEENVAALQQSNAGVEEMAAGANTVARASTDGAAEVMETSQATSAAVTKVGEVIRDMNEVGKKSTDNENQIRTLAQSVEQISGFVSVITGIADQTNLLALNAAIEAARAGEAGRGFAVVAEEVRKLAEESGHAAGSVNKLISELQHNAQAAITSTVESAQIVRSTLGKADEAQRNLDSAITRMKSVNENIQNIAAIAEEQAASTKEMAGAIDKITQGTVEVSQRSTSVQHASSETSSASEGVAKSAQVLSEHSAELSEQLAHFKVNPQQGRLPG